MSKSVAYYKDHVGLNPKKFYKTTLFREDNLMLGLNCLEPGQTQKVHLHDDQDKFYYVIEGEGLFTVGEDVVTANGGHIVWAKAGVPHGVENLSNDRLTILVGISPAPR